MHQNQGIITRYLLILSATLLLFHASAQTEAISGVVTNKKGLPLPFVSVHLTSAEKGTTTDSLGRYRLNGLRPGEYEISVSRVDFLPVVNTLKVEPGVELTEDFILSERINELGTVKVIGKSKAEELRETGYAVDVIETRAYKNLSSDVNAVLKNTSGVLIREAGGVGSGFQLSLNGLSGNQVRYFIDGVPMESFGSSLTLNNYPVNLIENIEIYKGVVPVHLGAIANPKGAQL